MMTDSTSIFETLERTLRQEGYNQGVKDGYKTGYSEGYQRALADFSEFTKNRAIPLDVEPSPGMTAFTQLQASPERQRRPKGENARIVKDALEGATGFMNPSEIRRLVEEKTGKTITYSSTRNALHQLKDELQVIEENGSYKLAVEAMEGS